MASPYQHVSLLTHTVHRRQTCSLIRCGWTFCLLGADRFPSIVCVCFPNNCQSISLRPGRVMTNKQTLFVQLSCITLLHASPPDGAFQLEEERTNPAELLMSFQSSTLTTFRRVSERITSVRSCTSSPFLLVTSVMESLKVMNFSTTGGGEVQLEQLQAGVCCRSTKGSRENSFSHCCS